MTKTKFSGNGPKQTDYWFIQTTWFGDDTGKPMNGHKPNMNSIADELAKEKYDLVIINSGWWDLKSWGEKDRGYDKCGEKFDGNCQKAYERDVQAVVDNLFDGRAGVFRESSCCGDYKSKADGKSVDSMNGVAEKVVKKGGYGFAKVFDLYDKDSVKDSTVDGPVPASEVQQASRRWRGGRRSRAQARTRSPSSTSSGPCAFWRRPRRSSGPVA